MGWLRKKRVESLFSVNPPHYWPCNRNRNIFYVSFRPCNSKPQHNTTPSAFDWGGREGKGSLWRWQTWTTTISFFPTATDISFPSKSEWVIEEEGKGKMMTFPFFTFPFVRVESMVYTFHDIMKLYCYATYRGNKMFSKLLQGPQNTFCVFLDIF